MQECSSRDLYLKELNPDSTLAEELVAKWHHSLTLQWSGDAFVC